MTDDAELMEVALFPIPNAVAFPGTVLPLHVFEPRYRRLVQECLRDDRMLGVSHTAGTIHEPRPKETLEEALNANQATFQPREIFAAGPCALLKTLEDGRLLVEVTMTHRLVLEQEIQSLPYRIVTCRPLQDEPPQDEAAARSLQHEVHVRLTELVRARNPEVAERLEAPAWTDLTPTEYSFRIFQILRFDADLMQQVLETTRPERRLELVRELLAGA